ncbi:MAG: hypothetical protein DI564_18295, partial [Rhodanobacter denitrificans]
MYRSGLCLKRRHSKALRRRLARRSSAAARRLSRKCAPSVSRCPLDKSGCGFWTSCRWATPLRLCGVLDVGSLAASLSELVRRHESLRTRFVTLDGAGVQVIDPACGFDLPVTDLSDLAPEAREAEAARLAQAEAEAPFDLARGPVFRARLLRLGAEEHVLLASMHHIVSDGWSLSVLTREVAALYEAFSRGEASSLPEPRVQYADYALWQRRWLDGETLERQLGYWRERLSGAPAALDLPTDRPRPPVASFRGGTVPVALPASLTAALGDLARGQGATLFMVLMAGFAAVLSRWSGQTDLVLG